MPSLWDLYVARSGCVRQVYLTAQMYEVLAQHAAARSYGCVGGLASILFVQWLAERPQPASQAPHRCLCGDSLELTQVEHRVHPRWIWIESALFAELHRHIDGYRYRRMKDLTTSIFTDWLKGQPSPPPSGHLLPFPERRTAE